MTDAGARQSTDAPSQTGDFLALARDVAGRVADPELPMVTLADLGILRGVEYADDVVTVSITPTYSGCPAMAEIGSDLRRLLTQAGFTRVVVRTALFPPWTSEWMTPGGRAKLAAAGVAPPHPSGPRGAGPVPLTLSGPGPAVSCPRCGSDQTRQTAAFSSTACKALYRCRRCDEPFEHFKAV